MSKKILRIIFIFICILSFNINANASTGYVSCTEAPDGLNLRTSIGGNVVTCLSGGNDIEILDNTLGSTSICNSWYKIKYNNREYYACGDYINTRVELSETEVADYKAYLKELGFPESYIPGLINLHNQYPNWQFRIYNTNLDWNTVIENESYQGRSLIYYTFGEGYRSLDSYSYNYQTDTFYRHPTEVNWWYASKDAIAYYMDPRNFLTEKNIFMFEALSYQPTFQTDTLIKKVLDNSFMPALYSRYFETDYSNAFLDGANTYKISPVHLATRILQENGINGSASSQGYFTYNGTTYNDVFNFYNIKATGTNPAIQGLIWAMGGLDRSGTSYGRPWNNPYKSIVGGAQFLSEGYISIGQDTLYFQKFDVSRDSGRYTHQYMQNITAPTSEATNTYNAYSKVPGLFEENLVFIIPVYKNMPSNSTSLPVNGNPNYYLKELKIDNEPVENFTYDKLNYTYHTQKDSITISGTTINKNAKISGAGKKTLSVGDNTIKITVTAENTKKITYNIKVVREEVDQDAEEQVSLTEILNNTGIKYNDNYIYGINPSTSVDSLVANIKKIDANTLVTIKNKDGNNITNTNFATGNKVIITKNKEKVELDVVIYGDINGDGAIDKLDYLQVLRYYYKYSTLESSYKEAADVNKDKVVDKLDYLAILRDYYGYSKITQ